MDELYCTLRYMYRSKEAEYKGYMPFTPHSAYIGGIMYNRQIK